MKIKNLNLLERHVEKITLAVAAAAGLLLVYWASQPATIEAPAGLGKAQLTAPEVEQEVSKALDEVESSRAKTNALSQRQLLGPNSLRNYLPEYVKSQEVPLPPELVKATVPQFAPLNSPVVPIELTPITSEFASTVPHVPTPTSLIARADRGVVIIPPAATESVPAPLPGEAPVPAGTLADLNWVVIGGRFPLLEFRDSMTDKGEKEPHPVPEKRNQITFYRVEVQRRERISGQWNNWQNVPPTKANGPLITVNMADARGEAVIQATDIIDTHWRNILTPPFYQSATGQPITGLLVPEPGAAGKTAPVAPGITPDGGPLGSDGSRAAGTGANFVAGVPQDLATIRLHAASVPFWFFDETVTPEQTYSYRVRMTLFNPVFQMDKRVKLIVASKPAEAMRNVPWLSSEWAELGGEVSINANQYFFFRAGLELRGGATVSVRIYKWSLGIWHLTEETAPIGGTIGRPQAGTDGVDFFTGYTLVDAVKTTDGDTQLVLLSPSGDLVSRSVRVDSNNKKMKELDGLIKLATPPRVPGKPGLTPEKP